MNINPAYSLVEDLISTRDLKNSGLQLKGAKTSKEETPYFMLKVSSPPPEGFGKHHVSVYKKLNSQTGGFSHYSLRSAEKVVRVFFDRFGTFFMTYARDQKGSSLPMNEEEVLAYRQIANNNAGEVVNKLRELTEKQFAKNRREAEVSCSSLESWSRKLIKKKPQNFCKALEEASKACLETARFCLDKPQKNLFYQRGKALQKSANRITAQLEQTSKRKTTRPSAAAAATPLLAPAEEATPASSISPRDLKREKSPKRDLSTIKKELAQAKAIQNPAELLQAQKALLEEKLAALEESNFFEIIHCFKELQDNLTNAKQELYCRLKEGDKAGFLQLLKMKCGVDYDTIYLLVAKGEDALFEQIYQEQPFALNIEGWPTELFFKLKNLPADRIVTKGKGGLLQAAFEHDQFKMFTKLLELGCRPNVLLGQYTLLYLTTISSKMVSSNENAQKYTKALIEFGANFNEGVLGPESFQAMKIEKESMVPVDSSLYVRDVKGEKFQESFMNFHTPFLFSLEFHPELAEEMLQTGKVKMSQRTRCGLTPFGVVTCRQNGSLNQKMAELLLSINKDLVDEWQFRIRETPEKITSKITPLFLACQMGRLVDVQFLIGKKADPNKTHICAFGASKSSIKLPSTPFQTAVVRGHTSVVEYLLKEGKISASAMDLVFTFLKKHRIENRETHLTNLCILVKKHKKEDLIYEKHKELYHNALKLRQFSINGILCSLADVDVDVANAIPGAFELIPIKNPPKQGSKKKK